MSNLTAGQLADMLEHKKDWSARVPLVEDLRAHEVDNPVAPPFALADLTETTASGTYADTELQNVMDVLAALVAGLKAAGIAVDP